jgi:hypothetical protein
VISAAVEITNASSAYMSAAMKTTITSFLGGAGSG